MKVSFDKDTYKRVGKPNDRVTIVALKGEAVVPDTWCNSEVGNWIKTKQNNPKVDYRYRAWTITARGKAVRAEEDENDPILAERIAECRAKIKIYCFMAQLASKCIRVYSKTLFGNDKLALSVFAQKGSMYDVYNKYKQLLYRENKYLQKLLSK